MSAACPACGATPLQDVLAVDGVPVNSCLLLDDPQEAADFPRGRLDLAFCRDCGFLTNRSFDPALAEYSPRYEETQAYSPTFVAFGRDLAATWVQRHDLTGAHVLEIGCGKGEFLGWLVEAGVGRATGIDPGVDAERLDPAVAARIDVLPTRYDASHRGLETDAIVCRHTLEHIGPVRDFLLTVHAHAADLDVPVLFELPDTRRVVDEAAFWDVYYEHCSYFTLGSLVRLFRSCGFEVLRAEPAYDDQYLLLEARPVPDDAAAGPVIDGEDDLDRFVRGVEHFGRRVEELASGWRDRLQRRATLGERTVLWGGGSKAVAFLTTLDLGPEIDAVVDINPRKQGRFIAGSGHEVVAPAALVDLRPSLIVVMNPVYLDEITDQVRALGLDSEVTPL